MNVKAELQLSRGDQRSGERYDTRMEVGVHRSGSVTVPATVTDMSANGFRVEAGETLPIDSVVWLKLGDLAPLMARVVWSDGPIAGCRFSAPLHPSMLEELVGLDGD